MSVFVFVFVFVAVAVVMALIGAVTVIVSTIGTVGVNVPMIVACIMIVGELMVVAVAVIVPMPVIVAAIVILVTLPGLLLRAVLVNTPAVALLVVIMAMRPAAIGAGLGLERPLQHLDRCAQPSEHIFQHMIRGNAQEPLADLHRDMPIAQVIGGLRQALRRNEGDMQNLLGFGDHFDHAPITRHDQVAAAQDLAARQHQSDLFAGGQPGAQAAFLARIEGQLQLAFDFEAVCAARDFQFCLDL